MYMNNKMYSTKTKFILQHNQFSNNIVVKKKPSIKITRNHSCIRKKTTTILLKIKQI